MKDLHLKKCFSIDLDVIDLAKEPLKEDKEAIVDVTRKRKKKKNIHNHLYNI